MISDRGKVNDLITALVTGALAADGGGCSQCTLDVLRPILAGCPWARCEIAAELRTRNDSFAARIADALVQGVVAKAAERGGSR